MDELREDWKSLVLQDFRQWLENLPEGAAWEDGDPETSCDQRSLYAEFASLRQEIRLQNREQAKVVRDLEKVAGAGETSIALLRQHTEEMAGSEDRGRQAAERRCLLPFLEVRDALMRGRNAAAKVSGSRSVFRRPPLGIEGVLQGYDMAIERFDRALALVGVQSIETVGRGFDAESMRAVETRTVANAADGVVVEEFRSGFVRGKEVLRPAEVVVNRRRNLSRTRMRKWLTWNTSCR